MKRTRSEKNSTLASDDPIEKLMQEHGLEMAYLGNLGTAVRSIETNGFSVAAFETIAESVRTIGKIIFSHSEREEQYLFPMIENHVEGPTNIMRSEHRKLWETYRSLMQSVQDVEDGRLSSFSTRDLLEMTKFLIEYLTNHINTENTVLYTMAKRVLTTDEYQKLRIAIAH